MTNSQINNIWAKAKMTSSTVQMLSDMLELEIDCETNEVIFGEVRLNMYTNVLALVSSQIEEIADAIGK